MNIQKSEQFTKIHRILNRKKRSSVIENVKYNETEIEY